MKYVFAVLLALIVLVPGVIFAENAGITTDDETGLPPVLDIEPSSTDVGPVANTGAEYKFDDGFYQKIQNLMDEVPHEGDPGVHDGTRYYNVILVVSRDDGDEREPDEVSKENKEAVVKRLKLLGARDIVAAEVLSFVTASIPVANVPGFSLHDEVYKLGDGELPVTPEIDTARQTIHATANEIRTATGMNLNGAGVTVAVIDTGINHATAFGNSITEHVTCNSTGGCSVSTTPIHSNDNPNETSHGTNVAQVLAASGLDSNNGIAPGVQLLDVRYEFTRNSTENVSTIAHALDWSLRHGADVVNMSFRTDATCDDSNPTTSDLIVNEAVDKGMILVKSAGNENRNIIRGVPRTSIDYSSISRPGCAHNIIAVGGIDDRDADSHTMATFTSRGPTDNDNRLKPDIVAPATNIVLLRNIADTTTYLGDGTSFAAPQVSASAALLLQAKPDLTPLQVRAALLLGASWQGPDQCTSHQYDRNDDDDDDCSFARQPDTENEFVQAASLGILNNVGLGVLNTAASLGYATSDSTHIASDYLNSDTDTKQFRFRITDTTQPIKIILTWLAHPHGGITDQETRDAVKIANLDFVTAYDGGADLDNASGKSTVQNNEFAVFTPPRTGLYTITVSGSGIDTLNKPVQNFALASTVPLAPVQTTSNSPPVAASYTVIASPGQERVIRLTASDSDNDAISFHVSADPSSGIVTTDEFINTKVSRVVYTPDATFTGDSFTVTPHDGTRTGTAGTITITAESLPSGWTDGTYVESDITDWDTYHITAGFNDNPYSHTFTGKSYSVSQIRVGSVNMEGIDAEIRTASETYTVAIPGSGDRTIDFASPITIQSVKFSVDGIEEEAVDKNNDNDSTDVRAYIGYKQAPCPDSASESSLSCPAPPTSSTYTTSLQAGLAIPDNTRTQSVTSTIKVPRTGTLNDITVSVNIRHPYIGDLKAILTSPSGTQITLHDRTGGGADNIVKTFTTTHANLKSLKGSQISGNWALSVGDYAGGDRGSLQSWGLILKYSQSTTTPTPTPTPTPTTQTTTLFSDDFESGQSKWTETGDGDWRIATSAQHYVPVVPSHSTSNKVLHVDNSDNISTITLKSSIDLSSYSTANLAFWRFIDTGLDNAEYLKVELYNGRSWNTIYHWSENRGSNDGVWHSQSYDLASYLGVSNFKIRFVAQMSSSTEDVQIDDVKITGKSKSTSTPAPTPTPTPTPSSSYSIYIADTDDDEIVVYSQTGTYLGQMVPRFTELDHPWDVAFGPDGHMYVADNANNKIRKYNGATGSAISLNWASTNSFPNALAWEGNELYVATGKGVERFSSSGSALGFFGDATRTPASSSTPRLLAAYGVVFGGDRMYVADPAQDKILYYTASSGRYMGEISGTSSSPPNTTNPMGLEYGPSIYGSGNSLYQSGDDNGRVNQINPSGSLVREITSSIDEPHGMDMDGSENLFVVNSDDDNVVKIAPGGSISIIISDRSLDDPIGIAIGPVYSGTSESIPESEPGDLPNDKPVFTVSYNGAEIYGPVTPESSPMIFTVQATDSEGDVISIDVLHDDLPESAISVTDNQDGTASVIISTADVPSGTYVFWVTVSDPDNYTREPYAVIIP